MKVVIDDKYPDLFRHYKDLYDNYCAGFPAPDPTPELQQFLIKNRLAIRTRSYGSHIHIDFPKLPWLIRFDMWLRRLFSHSS